MYGYTGFGNAFTGNTLGLPVGIVFANGVLTFDGNGHWSIREAEVINGAVVATDAQLAGELTFLSDCTFATSIQGQPIFVGVVVDRGKQIRAMATVPGVQVNCISTYKIRPVDDQR